MARILPGCDRGFNPLHSVGRTDSLHDAFAAWRRHPVCRRHDCACLEANCAGPCLLVADAYYRDWHFPSRRARWKAPPSAVSAPDAAAAERP